MSIPITQIHYAFFFCVYKFYFLENIHLLVCKKTGEEIKIKDKCGNCTEAIVVLEELMKQFNRRLQQIKNHKC